MRIAVLSPVWFPVPPTRYGGIEWIVSLLAEGLVGRDRGRVGGVLDPLSLGPAGVGEHELGPGQAGGPQQGRDLAAEPTAAHEHEPLAVLGELVGHLHRHAAAQRVPDEGRPLVPERDHQVADAARVGAERVVAARLGRLAVAEQVGRDDGEALGEVGEHPRPRGGGRRDAVHEHDHRPAAGRSVREAVTVQDYLLQLVAVGDAAVRGCHQSGRV